MLLYLVFLIILIIVALAIIFKNYRLVFTSLFGVFIALSFSFIVNDQIEELPASSIVEQPFFKQRFISNIAEQAVKSYPKTSVLPSVTISQAILESDWGESELSAKYNNYFGIKSSSKNKSQYVRLPTREVVNNKTITVNAKFARYTSVVKSIEAHATLLKQGTTDDSARYKKVLNAKNYIEATNALGKSGYATDPNYAELLKEIIKKYKLVKYDNQAKKLNN